MILAQADLNSLPAGFLKYLIIAVVAAIMVSSLIAGTVFAGLQYFQSKRAAGQPQTREITPNPLQVQEVHTFATERDCLTRHSAIVTEIANLKADQRKDAGDLHEKINKVDREVGGLMAATQLQNGTLSMLSTKLDRIIENKLTGAAAGHPRRSPDHNEV